MITRSRRGSPRPLLLLSLVFALTGCGSQDAINIVAVDRSGSTAGIRRNLRLLLVNAFNRSQDAGQQFAAWAVDRQAICLYGPRKAELDRLPPEVQQQLEPGAAPKTETRTRPALFWEEMANRYPQSPTLVRIAYLTDGGNDFAGDLSRIQAAVQRLARNPKVYVTIAGVQADQRGWLERAFAPLGPRFQIAGRGEEEPALEQWMALGTERK